MTPFRAVLSISQRSPIGCIDSTNLEIESSIGIINFGNRPFGDRFIFIPFFKAIAKSSTPSKRSNYITGFRDCEHRRSQDRNLARIIMPYRSRIFSSKRLYLIRFPHLNTFAFMIVFPAHRRNFSVISFKSHSIGEITYRLIFHRSKRPNRSIFIFTYCIVRYNFPIIGSSRFKLGNRIRHRCVSL